MSDADVERMRLAIIEAERARGSTGDNPWVGCVIVSEGGEIIGRGHTRGPGEDHAEIGALRELEAAGLTAAGSTLYSTLEPCSFHGRTPACSRVIVNARVARVVTGMRDPNPRVDGEGARILVDAGIEVLEGVCEAEVRRQLGVWVVEHHLHEPIRRAREIVGVRGRDGLEAALQDIYAIDAKAAAAIAAKL